MNITLRKRRTALAMTNAGKPGIAHGHSRIGLRTLDSSEARENMDRAGATV